jgi:CubicO group peptidase (beta-lactamase class C family)
MLLPVATLPSAAKTEGLPALREKLDRYLEGEIERASFPGAVYAVGDSSGVLVQNALGYSVLKPAKIKAHLDTIYDVASLTKPLITTTLTLQAHAEGRIDLHEPVSKHLTELRGTDKAELTFIDLLTHRGGFQAWYPLYTHGLGPQKYLEALLRRPLRYKPGTREIYTCLGFITLHLAMTKVYGRPLEQVAKEKLFDPLELRRSLFNPAPEMKYGIAATEWGNSNERRMVADRGLKFSFRDYMIWGEVDDGNAYYMGGYAGNAGLFSTAGEVFTIAHAYLTGGGALLPSELVKLALRNYTVGLEENRGLGWQLQSSRSTHPSSVLSENCYGHTGFTGTSVWVDPERDLIIVLLTNRLHPTIQPFNMQIVRRNVHALVAETWDRR